MGKRIGGTPASFKPGQPRPANAGRKKGTPNKSTLALCSILSELKLDPVRALNELLPQLEPKDQASVHMKLMEYIYPKRRAEDGSGDPGDVPASATVALTFEQIQILTERARGEKK